MKNLFKELIIDLELLSISNLNLNELLTLVKIYASTIHKQFLDYELDEKEIKSLQSKSMIRIVSPTKYVLRDIGKRIVEKTINIEILDKIEHSIVKENDIEILVDKIRSKFQGLKKGAMGDKNSLIEKLTRWRINNPSVTEKQILDAVDSYLDSQSNLTYIQRADYFIYKKSGQTESSRLSIWVEEMGIPKENSDWASEVN